MNNPEQERKVCEACGIVNPGTLKEKKGRILCLGCRANMEVINKERYAELEKELRRCVTVMDTDATLPDGSNPSTMVAHVLLGDFCEAHA